MFVCIFVHTATHGVSRGPLVTCMFFLCRTQTRDPSPLRVHLAAFEETHTLLPLAALPPFLLRACRPPPPLGFRRSLGFAFQKPAVVVA